MSYRKAVKVQLDRYGKSNSWNININFNLGLPQSSNSMANTKIEDFDIILDNLASFANES